MLGYEDLSGGVRFLRALRTVLRLRLYLRRDRPFPKGG